MLARLLILPPLAVAATWYLLDGIGYSLPIEALVAALLATLALAISYSLFTHPRPATIFGTILGVILLPVAKWIALPVVQKLGYNQLLAPVAALATSAFIALLVVQPWVRYRKGPARARDRVRPVEEVDR